MQANNLRAEIVRRGWTMEKLAAALGMSDVTLRRKMHLATSRGEPDNSEFDRAEILAIKDKLGLTDGQILEIFFS